MSFLEDVTGKGHRTFEEGSQSVFLRVPEDFDVKKWAKGNQRSSTCVALMIVETTAA